MRTELKLFLMIWLVYAIYVAPAGGVAPNRYVDLVHSIVNEGRFAIDTYQENTIDKSYYNGHYYVGALPGPAFLAVPAYVIFKGVYALIPQSVKETAGGVESYQKDKQPNSSFYGQVDNVEFFFSQAFLTLTVLAVASALGSVLLFRSVRLLGYTDRVVWSVTLLYAFGTNVFFYSTVFFDHVFSATLSIAAFYLILRSTRPARGLSAAAFWAGLLAGANLLVEYPNIFVAALLGLWLLRRGERRDLTFYVAGFAIPIFVLMAYNWISFSNPIATPYMYETEANKAFHVPGFFGVTYPHLDRLGSLFLSQERGLFLFMPITLIGLIGIFHQIYTKGKHLPIVLFCGAVVVAYAIFYASYSVWDGGAAFGPRFLIPMLPFLSIGVAFAFDLLSRYLIYGVGLLSIFINWLGAQFGFADSPIQHIQDLLAQGPTLPVFGAVLSHSTDHHSSLYLFASQYHALLTLAVTGGLIGLFVWTFRDVLRYCGRDSRPELKPKLAQIP